MTEDEMVGWHHQLNGHEFEQIPGDVKDREAWRVAVCGVIVRHNLATEPPQPALPLDTSTVSLKWGQLLQPEAWHEEAYRAKTQQLAWSHQN